MLAQLLFHFVEATVGPDHRVNLADQLVELASLVGRFLGGRLQRPLSTVHAFFKAAGVSHQIDRQLAK
ncbi:hypothetical protein [Pseudomonas koreensis]|uniref:hypothetical protein n=1 Tax=Pseudomonas koreensis TaxID=198620 RepID=UPI0018E6C057|nr:hypothetical protein [Pseudomonas koreensis]MBI6948797.1 hypothetical protein [Pseudomonas koreensis]